MSDSTTPVAPTPVVSAATAADTGDHVATILQTEVAQLVSEIQDPSVQAKIMSWAMALEHKLVGGLLAKLGHFFHLTSSPSVPVVTAPTPVASPAVVVATK